MAIGALGARWTLLYAGGVPVITACAALIYMRARVRAALLDPVPVPATA